MKIAMCLYGQPRNYKKGYETIKAHIIDKFKNVDIFFHTWQTDTKYNVSPWRPIDQTKIEIEDVINLYKPKSFLTEKSMIFYPCLGNGFDKTQIQQKNNISNILSQYYSRTMVRNIFLSYCQSNNIQYDIVIATRFDINITKFLDNFDTKKITFCMFHQNRPLIFNDNIVVCGAENFLKLFNFYPNINRYVLNGPMATQNYSDSPDKKAIFSGTIINSEELLSASLIDNNLLELTEKSDNIQTSLF